MRQRFVERVESAKRDESKMISVTTLEGFQSRYNWYHQHNKDAEAITFDSNNASPQEIALKIEKLIDAEKS